MSMKLDDDFDDRPLTYERDVDHPLSPAELRVCLMDDVRNHETVEVAADYAAKELFPDISLTTWCRSVNLGFRTNPNPSPEWRTYATIQFYLLPRPSNPIESYE